MGNSERQWRTIVPVPKNHNTRDENKSIKNGEVPEAKPRAHGLKIRIHRKDSNRTKSAVRARVEHVFGAQINVMGGTRVRTIGLARAKAKIEMMNLTCNLRRFAQLRRINPCPV